MAKKLPVVCIQWKCYSSYDDARKRRSVVYLREW